MVFVCFVISGSPAVRCKGDQIPRRDDIHTVMIGDSLRRDIAGAKNVGMSTIWVNRTYEQATDDILPDFEVADLSAVISILTRQ